MNLQNTKSIPAFIQDSHIFFTVKSESLFKVYIRNYITGELYDQIQFIVIKHCNKCSRR